MLPSVCVFYCATNGSMCYYFPQAFIYCFSGLLCVIYEETFLFAITYFHFIFCY